MIDALSSESWVRHALSCAGFWLIVLIVPTGALLVTLTCYGTFINCSSIIANCDYWLYSTEPRIGHEKKYFFTICTNKLLICSNKLVIYSNKLRICLQITIYSTVRSHSLWLTCTISASQPVNQKHPMRVSQWICCSNKLLPEYRCTQFVWTNC